MRSSMDRPATGSCSPRVATTAPAPGMRWDGPLLGSSDRDRLQATRRRARRVPPRVPALHLLPAGRPDRRGRDAEDVPPRGRTARAAVPLRRTRRDSSTGCGRSSGSSAASRSPSTPTCRSSWASPRRTAEGVPAVLHRPQAAVQEARRRVPEGRGGGDPEATRRAAGVRGAGHTAGRSPEKRSAELLALYRTIRGKGAAHDEAFRGVLARVLVAPAFLFRIEHAPAGKEPGPVNDWELATRLSYFLWSSAPDDELRTLAAAGQAARTEGARGTSRADARRTPVRGRSPSSSARSGFTSAGSTS